MMTPKRRAAINLSWFPICSDNIAHIYLKATEPIFTFKDIGAVIKIYNYYLLNLLHSLLDSLLRVQLLEILNLQEKHDKV